MNEPKITTDEKGNVTIEKTVPQKIVYTPEQIQIRKRMLSEQIRILQNQLAEITDYETKSAQAIASQIHENNI